MGQDDLDFTATYLERESARLALKDARMRVAEGCSIEEAARQSCHNGWSYAYGYVCHQLQTELRS